MPRRAAILAERAGFGCNEVALDQRLHQRIRVRRFLALVDMRIVRQREVAPRRHVERVPCLRGRRRDHAVQENACGNQSFSSGRGRLVGKAQETTGPPTAWIARTQL